MTDNYRGFGLFNDVEDKGLQSYNRARILVNMMEDNEALNADGERGVSVKGAALVSGYFMQVPEADREQVRDEVERILTEKGMLNGR